MEPDGDKITLSSFFCNSVANLTSHQHLELLSYHSVLFQKRLCKSTCIVVFILHQASLSTMQWQLHSAVDATPMKFLKDLDNKVLEELSKRDE